MVDEYLEPQFFEPKFNIDTHSIEKLIGLRVSPNNGHALILILMRIIRECPVLIVAASRLLSLK